MPLCALALTHHERTCGRSVGQGVSEREKELEHHRVSHVPLLPCPSRFPLPLNPPLCSPYGERSLRHHWVRSRPTPVLACGSLRQDDLARQLAPSSLPAVFAGDMIQCTRTAPYCHRSRLLPLRRRSCPPVPCSKVGSSREFGVWTAWGTRISGERKALWVE